MVEKDKFLVVVSVLTGRKFPRRPRHQLIAEARFDGELLATDPADHVENPDFTQELAWELDKKGLHQHRLQRTSIKVQLYAVDTQTSAKEAIGFVVLDLRSAQNQQILKWYPLLHSKYYKSKPDVHLGIYIDDDKGVPGGDISEQRSPARRAADIPVYYDAKYLKPVLDETEGFYQIGPAAKCADKFVLSVTIAFATNLPQLVPTTIPLPPTGFFFYYTLFGNDVTNEVFHDLLSPSFPAERASVRLRSSVEALQQFFASQPGLQIHLCCGDQSLGNCEIHLKDLLKPGSTEIYMKPVSIEGAFQLHPPNRLKQMLPAVPEDQRPLVGVSIILRKEDMASSSPKRDSPTGKKSDLPPPGGPPAEATKRTSPKSSPKQKRTPQKKDKHKPAKAKRALTPPPSPQAPPTPHDGSYTETFESGSKSENNVASLGEEVRKAAVEAEQQDVAGEAAASSQQAEPHPEPEPAQPQAGVRTEQTEDSSSTTQHHIVVPPQAYHFTFSIDLRSVSHLQVAHHANVFLRYTYPFFGSATPIMTNPPVEVRKGMEVLLPQSYCAFDFATTPQQLVDTLTRVPLYVEVWDRDSDKSQNVLLGAAQVNLNNVLQSERAKAVNSSGMAGWRQVWSHKVAAQAAENLSTDSAIAEIAVVLTLEDWGPITQKVTIAGENSQVYSISQSSEAPKQASPEPVKPVDVRETPEYKAALELEMWKEQQESLFESQLKEKEAQYMRVLAEEWKRRDKEREVVVKKKLSEYNQLEQQLRKSLADLEKREKQLAANEQEVLRLRKELQREHEWKMTEMRDASRRLKEDCDFKVEIERKKISHLEDVIQRLKSQLAEAEAKTVKIEKEFALYKEQQSTKSEVRLQAEIHLLTLEKVELERKVETLTKSKIHYKQQWGRALKELARIKQKEQAIAKVQLRKQQQELEHMRLRYLAAEEKEVVKSEQKELEEIKNELNQLREQESQRSEASKMTLSSQQPLYTTDTDNADDDHITRLIEERDTLLRTGVYTNDDRIISELDRQIREAISKKGSSLHLGEDGR